MACANCEVLPAPLPQAATLYLCPPLSHSTAKLRHGLRAIDVAFSEPLSGILQITLEDGGLERIAAWCEVNLTAAEQTDTRSLVCPTGVTPGLAELMQADQLSHLVGRLRGEWLVELMQRGALRTHFQPIVRAANPRELVAYECLLRAEALDGSTIGAPALLDAARGAGLLFQLDRAARLAAIADTRRFGIQAQLFINFLPTAIYDPTFCLRTTIAAIEEANLPPSQVVFEVVESEEVTDPRHLVRIVRHYRERGFRVALDDMGAGYSSLNLLAELRPDYLKLDMGLVRGVDHDPYKASIANHLLEMAVELGIISLGEGVETPEELVWLREHGVQLAQGFLFARAGSPPPTVA